MRNKPVPSIKTLQLCFTPEHMPVDLAKKLRAIMSGKVDFDTLVDISGPAGRQVFGNWYQDKSIIPVQLTMYAIDALLGTHGVEYFEHRCRSYEYCNTGDSYGTTIIYCNESKTFRVGTWGNVVER